MPKKLRLLWPEVGKHAYKVVEAFEAEGTFECTWETADGEIIGASFGGISKNGQLFRVAANDVTVLVGGVTSTFFLGFGPS